MMISPSEFALEGLGNISRDVAPLEFRDFEEIADEQRSAQYEEQERNEEISRQVLDENIRREETETREKLIERVSEDVRRELHHAFAQDMEEKVASVRARVTDACEQFLKERTRYFSEVEEEVVRLALAIAAQVLHREVMLDPLLLRGAVKVALEKLKESSGVTLRIPEGQMAQWQATLREETATEVRLVSDKRMQPGECRLETSVGQVDLGIKAQLEEIERGFFDLLQKRPA
jgi:flagellar assembly protein FliH